MPRRAAGGAAAPTAVAAPPPPLPAPADGMLADHQQQPSAGEGQQQRWRKVLYERQPGGDAYTGEGFLEELVVNATVPHRRYATVAWSTLVVDQELCTVAALGSASYHLYTGTISARQLLLADALLMALGALLYLASAAWAAAAGRAAAAAAALQAGGGSAPQTPAASPSKPRRPGRAAAAAAAGANGAAAAAAAAAAAPLTPSASPSKHPRSAAGVAAKPGPPPAPPLTWAGAADGLASMSALAAATALLSPLLGTLTETVSSDSIVACACGLKLAHLYLHDYHFTAALTSHVSGSLALGCAVCGSVLVASRLRSPAAVYAQLLLSLELYILGPYLRRQVAAASPAAHAALTAALAAAAAALLARQSALLTWALGGALAFVTLVCPWWLVRIHKFKAAINGPWDEAVPRLSRAVRAQLARR